MPNKSAWIILATIGAIFTCTIAIAAVVPATIEDGGRLFPADRPVFVPSPTPVPTATQAPTSTPVPPTATPVRAPTPRPTARPAPTNAPNREPTSYQIEQWMEQMAAITLWSSLNIEPVQACILLGNIDWDDYDSRFTRVTGQIEAIGVDATDGKFDRFTASQIDRIISEAFSIMREIDRKCGF